MMMSLAAVLAVAAAAPAGGELPDLLSIDWKRLPDLVDAQGYEGSGGFQNSDGGWISHDSVVTAFGHGPGHAGKPLTEFLSSAYLLNVTAASASSCLGGHAGGAACKGWQRLPDAPVSGRQDVASSVIGGAVYIVGGFSYSAPYSYSDFLRLGPEAAAAAGGGGEGGGGSADTPAASTWSWQRLPSFPYPLSMHAVASIGSKFYVQGGACYNRKAFFSFTDCTGGTPGLGKRLYVFDTAKPTSGWTRLPDNPGPPRANAAMSSVNGSLYVLGGMTFVPKTGKVAGKTTAMTLVDNWKYDTAAQKWSRLPDFPIASCNFQTNGPQTSFQDRYIILIGGYQYGNTYYANASTGPSFGVASRLCPTGVDPTTPRGAGCLKCGVQMPNITYMGPRPSGSDWSREYNSDVFVFDTRTSTFGRARGTSHADRGLIPTGEGCSAAFPINNNLPQANVLGASIFAIGGECNDRIIPGTSVSPSSPYSRDYGHYPPLALYGQITALP